MGENCGNSKINKNKIFPAFVAIYLSIVGLMREPRGEEDAKREISESFRLKIVHNLFFSRQTIVSKVPINDFTSVFFVIFV